MFKKPYAYKNVSSSEASQSKVISKESKDNTNNGKDLKK